MEEKQDIVETIFKSKATPATKPLKRSHRSIELNVKHIRLTLFQGVDRISGKNHYYGAGPC